MNSQVKDIFISQTSPGALHSSSGIGYSWMKRAEAMHDDDEEDDKYRAPALSKGLDILELLASSAEGRSQADISKTLGRTTTEIFRMLVVLRKRGYVQVDDGDDQQRGGDERAHGMAQLRAEVGSMPGTRIAASAKGRRAAHSRSRHAHGATFASALVLLASRAMRRLARSRSSAALGLLALGLALGTTGCEEDGPAKHGIAGASGGGAAELVLVIDQFEEVFTLLRDEKERLQFLELLVSATLDQKSRVRVVLTLRADFIDRPLNYVDFGELLHQRMELVLPLTPDELENAITAPAERVGLHFETGLVFVILRDLGDQPGTLPLLQYALTELYEKRVGNTLTKSVYHEIGGVLGALGLRAEEIFTGWVVNLKR